MGSSSADERNTRKIQTAACLIIGDEVLGGKTVDTNSAYFAKFCFGLSINLKRVEVISDDEAEIIEAVRRMSDNYDFVVTSGGIGPTYVCWGLLCDFMFECEVGRGRRVRVLSDVLGMTISPINR